MGYEDVSPPAHHFLPQVNSVSVTMQSLEDGYYPQLMTASLFMYSTAFRKYGPKQTDGKEASL